jgi:hypothetical protein
MLRQDNISSDSHIRNCTADGYPATANSGGCFW